MGKMIQFILDHIDMFTVAGFAFWLLLVLLMRPMVRAMRIAVAIFVWVGGFLAYNIYCGELMAFLRGTRIEHVIKMEFLHCTDCFADFVRGMCFAFLLVLDIVILYVELKIASQTEDNPGIPVKIDGKISS